jgi:hypothetical protein
MGTRAAPIADLLHRQLDHGLSILLRSISLSGNWLVALSPWPKATWSLRDLDLRDLDLNTMLWAVRVP